MAKKITIAEQFATVKAVLLEVGREDLAEFIQGRADIAAKKSGNRKPTKNQLVNAGIKKDILALLETTAKKMTVGDMLASGAFPEGTSSQKITALLRQLGEAGTGEVIREKTSKGILFSLPGVDYPEEVEDTEEDIDNTEDVD